MTDRRKLGGIVLLLCISCSAVFADVDVENEEAEAFTLSVYARVRYSEFGGALTIPDRTFSIESSGITADFVIDDGLEGQFQLEARPGEVFIKDCYITWEATKYGELQAGRFKKPFSLNTLISNWNLQSISHSISHRKLTDLLYSGRDIGIAILFDTGRDYLPELTLGVFNGSADPVNQDNEIQYAARMDIELPAGIMLGADLSTLRFGEQDTESVSGYITSPRQIAWGTDIQFAFDATDDLSFLLRSEYLRGDNWELADVIHEENAPIFETWWVTGGFTWKTDTPLLDEVIGSISMASWRPDRSADPREDELTVTLGFNTSTPVSFRLAAVNHKPHEMPSTESATDYLAELLLDI